MKRKWYLLSLLTAFVLFACEREEDPIQNQELNTQEMFSPLNGTPIDGQYIIIFKEDFASFKSTEALSYEEQEVQLRDFARQMLKENTIQNYEIQQVFSKAIKGLALQVSKEEIEILKKDSRIKYIEQDMHIMRPPWERDDNNNDNTEGQEIPYGIERVGSADGTGKVAWIIDTGIDLDHEDLNVDVDRGFTAFTKGPDSESPDDKNGHGTHCAGTVAAIDNGIGVIGVAAGALVVPVKVLDKRGAGSISSVIKGVDYVAANASPGDAANMSLGGGVSFALDSVVLAASQSGIFFALAAGNESDDANNHSPARVNGDFIWTVSAMDQNDNYASFSNYGNPPIDYCQPGVKVQSAWKDNSYRSISGTSMAAPHLCGVLLITNGAPSTNGFVNNDPDGNADPIARL